MILSTYKGLMTVLGPAVDAYLAHRLARGKEDQDRIAERRGVAGRARPPGRLVWMHAASIGEAVGLLPLVEALDAARPDLTLLMTTGTVTSAAAMSRRLPSRAIHQFVPVDRPSWVRRFLNHWRPDAAIWMESDLWPALLTETAARGIPLALVDARMSDDAFARWRRFAPVVRPLFDAFDLVLASSDAQADRFRRLGCRDVRFVANLKASAAPPPIDDAACAELREMIGGRPAWLAANTHAGEEAVVLDAHIRLAANRPGALTVIAPRHATRGDEVAALVRERGLTLARRSAGEPPTEDVAVYLADTMGEMTALYAALPVTFLAGSLVPVGGHSPVEPAHCGTALLFGPRMPNNRDAADALLAAGAAREINGADALAASVAGLWEDGASRAAMAEAGRRVAAEGRAGLQRIVSALEPMLPPAAAAGAQP